MLALAALPGTALGRLGEPSAASAGAWAAAGAAVRMLHDAPLPPWPGRSVDEIGAHLDGECEWLVANGVLPADLVTRNRQLAETALRPWTPVFIHGDLQVDSARLESKARLSRGLAVRMALIRACGRTRACGYRTRTAQRAAGVGSGPDGEMRQSAALRW